MHAGLVFKLTSLLHVNVKLLVSILNIRTFANFKLLFLFCREIIYLLVCNLSKGKSLYCF